MPFVWVVSFCLLSGKEFVSFLGEPAIILGRRQQPTDICLQAAAEIQKQKLSVTFLFMESITGWLRECGSSK